MSYSMRMQKNNLYCVYQAPRGRVRMVDLGMQIAEQYLSPYDRIVGIIGNAGSGKSMLIKGMFPGLDLTNDDEGVNIRPLPLLDVHEDAMSFYGPHTYHADIRFELAFTPLHELASAVLEVARQEKRVIVEHFEMLYPALGRNADLLIGIGEEVIITRPTVLGPDPQNIADLVYKTLPYRLMAHTAEDLCVCSLGWAVDDRSRRSDVRHGFVLEFDEKPPLDPKEIEAHVKEKIDKDLPISYGDDDHVVIGDEWISCQAPRMHVKSTGCIEDFSLVPEFIYDQKAKCYMLIGQVGSKERGIIKALNKIRI